MLTGSGHGPSGSKRGVQLGLGAINTPADEFDVTLVADRGVVFARSTDVDNDPIVLHYAARGPAGFAAGTPLADGVNVAGSYTLGPSLDPTDSSILYFSGQRPEASAGKMDIYQVRFQAK